MYLDLEDKGLARELLRHRIHEPLSTGIMKEILKPGQVVIDIGANIGYYAFLEAKRVGESGRVYCLEPAPENFNLLQKNVVANQYNNMEVFNAAAGAETGTGTIYLSKSHNQHALVSENVSGSAGSAPVMIYSLDDFLKGKPDPDLIRMDVEGLELDILKGMKSMLAQKKPLKLFIEVHGFFLKEKVREFFTILKVEGFKINVCAWEPPLIGGGRPVRALFDYCASKIGRGRAGLFHFTIENMVLFLPRILWPNLTVS